MRLTNLKTKNKMKNWKELTTKELAELDYNTIELYRKYLCAEKGIPFSIEKPVEPNESVPEKDLTIYTLKGVDYVCFTDFNEAQKVQEVLNSCKSIGKVFYSSSSNKYFREGLINEYDNGTKTTVQSSLVYSEELIKEVDDLASKNCQQAYKDALAHYEQVMEDIENATADFDKAYKNAVDTMYRREKLVKLYTEEYIPLANNDEIALSFLAKAYNISDEDKEYIKQYRILTRRE